MDRCCSTCLGEVTLDLNDGVALTLRDDGEIFDLTDSDAGVSSLRAYLVANVMASQQQKFNLVATGTNRNCFRFRFPAAAPGFWYNMPDMKKLMIELVGAALLAGCGGSNSDTLKMITEATFPPYEFLRGQDVIGIDVEICRAVAEKLGKEFRCETVDFDSVIPAVISGKADLAAAGITVTEDRKKNVDFSVPYVKTGIVVISRKSSPFTDVAQLKGKKIGVQSGTTSETFVLEQLKQEPERVRSPAEAVVGLKSGRNDFVIADIDPAKNSVKGEPDLQISDFITSEEYAIAIRKGQPELLNAINETIAELKANGRLAKWIADFTAEADKLKDK